MTVTVDPYYQDELVTIYHGDWRYAWAALDGESTAVAVTDPPYGIGYESGMPSATIARSIVGDRDTTERDTFLNMWGDRPALVFGSWRAPRPDGTRMRLGRPAVGVEINERYCAIAAERLGGPIRVEDGAFNFSEEV